MKRISSTPRASIHQDLQVVIIKRSKGISSQEIRMKMSPNTSFAELVRFMWKQELLNTRKVIITSTQNADYPINHSRRLRQFVDLMKLSFYVEAAEDRNSLYGQKLKAYKSLQNLHSDSSNIGNLCGKEQCNIM